MAEELSFLSDEQSVEIETEDDSDDEAQLDAAFEQLVKRCEIAKISSELLRDYEDDKFLRMKFPCGRDTRLITIFRLEHAQRLLAV